MATQSSSQSLFNGRESCAKRQFERHEKWIARLGFALLVLVGLVALYQKSPNSAFAYAVIVVVCSLLLVYDLLCPYCPYPYKYKTCLLYPHQLLTWVTRHRTRELGPVRRTLIFVAFGLLLLVPQYGLLGNWSLFVVFWLLGVLLGLLFFFSWCPQCYHRRCPFHRVSVEAAAARWAHVGWPERREENGSSEKEGSRQSAENEPAAEGNVSQDSEASKSSGSTEQ